MRRPTPSWCAKCLDIAPEAVRVVEGDTDRIAFGFGSGGSRCSALGTAAIMKATEKVIEKGRRIAAHILEAAEADITFADGTYTVAGYRPDAAVLRDRDGCFQPGAPAARRRARSL